jgi:hypothetical protein
MKSSVFSFANIAVIVYPSKPASLSRGAQCCIIFAGPIINFCSLSFSAAKMTFFAALVSSLAKNHKIFRAAQSQS